jgi:hypothetical protein
MRQSINVDNYVKACKAEEARRRAVTLADNEAHGGEDKKNKCVGKVVVPTTMQQKRKDVSVGTQSRKGKGVDIGDTRSLQPSSSSGRIRLKAA